MTETTTTTLSRAVSFPDDLETEIPADILYPHQVVYESTWHIRCHVGDPRCERAARKLQRFLKPLLRILFLHNDQETEFLEEIDAIWDLQQLELANIIEDKEDALAAIKKEWEAEELDKLQAEELHRLQHEKKLRYNVIDEIMDLQKEYLAVKGENARLEADLKQEQRLAKKVIKIEKLVATEWNYTGLLKEVKDEVDRLQDEISRVKQDTVQVTQQKNKKVDCIQKIEGLLNQQGLSWSQLAQNNEMQQQPEEEEEEKEDPTLDSPPPSVVKVLSTPAKDQISTLTLDTTFVLQDRKEEETKEKRSSSLLSFPNLLSHLQFHFAPKGTPSEESQCSKNKKRVSIMEEKKDEPSMTDHTSDAGKEKEKAKSRPMGPPRRPTFLLNRLHDIVRGPTRQLPPESSTSVAGQQLMDRRQRFSHAKEFSTKELAVARAPRPVHPLPRQGGRLNLVQ